MILENVKTRISESSCFRTPFEIQRVHGSQTLLKYAQQHFYPNFPLIQDNVSHKTSLLVTSGILGVFGNTLTANRMYSRHNWEKFPQHVQTPLPPKRKNFPEVFIAFSQSTKNFAHFEKKDQLHSLNIWEIIDSEKCGYLNTRKLLF